MLFQKRIAESLNSRLFGAMNDFRLRNRRLFNTSSKRFDVAILGGGVIGSSIAFFLKILRPDANFKVAVIERDDRYIMAASPLSVGGFRQQFSGRENIEISLFSNSFLKNFNSISKNEKMRSPIRNDFESVDLQMFEEGYLSLASTSDGESTLRENVDMQITLGAKVIPETPIDLKKRFPWLRTDDLKLGVYGHQNEGWLDPWSLLLGFKARAKALGVSYIKDEIESFSSTQGDSKIDIIKCQNGIIEADKIVNACGPWSGYINHQMKGAVSMSLTDLPVTLRKRQVFVLKLPQDEAKKFDKVPLLFDPTGFWIRRDGRMKSATFLVGKCPPIDDDPDFFWSPMKGKFQTYDDVSKILNDNPYDPGYFEKNIWEDLALRIPSFESCKVVGGWSGYYDYNYFDQNGIIGKHSELKNVLIASGFSGHGLQQSPAVGLAIAELILFNEYRTLHLERMGMQRIRESQPLIEKAIY